LVTKMDTGFQHFTHGYGHELFSRVRSGARPVTPPTESVAGTLGGAGSRFTKKFIKQQRVLS